MCHLCGDSSHIADWLATDNQIPSWQSSPGSTFATGGTAVGATGDQNINGLLGGVKWNSNSVDFNFPSLATYYVAPYGTATGNDGVTQVDLSTGFVAASASFQDMTRKALAEFQAVTGLVFNEVGAGSASNISIGRTTHLGSGTPMGFSGYGYFPGSSQRAGDIWFASDFNSVGDTFVLGRGTYTLVLHELGHAMGLKHGHQTGGPANTAMQAAFDFNDYTIMSYRREQGGATSGLSSQGFSRPQSLMMYDILALQTMYGANYTTNNGNTVYTFSTTTGQMSVNGVGGDVPGNGAAGSNRIYRTIWDGGGVDTYDVSNYGTNLVVDLTPGGRSVLDTNQLAIVNSNTNGLATGNLFNALLFNGDTRSLIENVIGGGGSDTLTGNIANNTLTGNGGNDTMSAGFGNDVMSGGSGTNSMTGAGGWDAANYAIASNAATVTRNANGTVTITGAGFSDTLSGVEVARFSDRTVALREHADSDITGDGTSDIVWRNASNGATNYFRIANGAFGSWEYAGFVDPSWVAVDTGDLDGNGSSDILFRRADGAIGYLASSAAGGFSWQGAGLVNTAWSLIGTGDVTGDGRADLVYNSAALGGALGYFDLATNSWTGLGTVNTAWTAIDMADFDGDGREEIVYHNAAAGTVGALNPLGTFEAIGSAISTSWGAVATGDFNGDGTADVLMQNAALGGALGYWATSSSGVDTWTGIPGLGPIAADWAITSTGNYNGDAYADILLYNANLDAAGVLAFQSGGGVTWTGLGPVNQAWQVV